ncbi:MAG: hypothetical protein MZV64_28950 [Ignavibacteriales bacterium]|nr:hypothetical protein [Ignavibacteriales bacterium]
MRGGRGRGVRRRWPRVQRRRPQRHGSRPLVEAGSRSRPRRVIKDKKTAYRQPRPTSTRGRPGGSSRKRRAAGRARES